MNQNDFDTRTRLKHNQNFQNVSAFRSDAVYEYFSIA